MVVIRLILWSCRGKSRSWHRIVAQCVVVILDIISNLLTLDYGGNWDHFGLVDIPVKNCEVAGEAIGGNEMANLVVWTLSG